MVKRWCDELHHRVEAKEIAPRTLKRIESYAKPNGHFVRLYEFSVFEITPGHLSDWNLWLMKREPRQNTRKHVVETMRTLFRWLHERGELEAARHFPTVGKRKHFSDVIAPDEQERVLAAIPEVERGIFVMAAEEVFRLGELRALNISDYDFKKRTVTVRYAMDGDTSNAAQRKTTKEEDIRVRRVTDSRYNAQALRLGWKRAANAVGLGHVGMYEGTKHSTLTEARRRGLPLDQLQRQPDTKTLGVWNATRRCATNWRQMCSDWLASRGRRTNNYNTATCRIGTIF